MLAKRALADNIPSDSGLLGSPMAMSVKTTESPNRIPQRKSPPAVQRADRPTIEQVEAALAEAPHLRLGRRLPHSEKFVSRASSGTLRPAEGDTPNSPIVWKDAAEFGKAQDLLKNKGHLEQQRREALRFGILVAAGTIVAITFVLLAFFK